MTAVIVLHYGSRELTSQCIESVWETAPHVDLLVVDNQGDWPHGGNVVRPGSNVGFARGCNLGAREAIGSVLVFVNNDCVAHPGWLEPLEEELADPKVGVAGSKLLYPDGTIQHSGVSVSFARQWGHEAVNGHRDWTKESKDVDAVTGACLAVTRNVFDQAGGFHEGFKNGYEDVDLCLQVSSLGYRIVYAPGSVLTHVEAASGPTERFAHVAHNVRLLRERWG